MYLKTNAFNLNKTQFELPSQFAPKNYNFWGKILKNKWPDGKIR
jgi:hypothetical protein